MSNPDLQLVPYSSKYKDNFKALNEAWIRQYFVMEDNDYKALDNPDDYIIKPGGYIVMALNNGDAVGTCALIKMTDEKFELAKMAVCDTAQGLGIGKLIGNHIIAKAKQLGAKIIYLESNTQLTPAINLYRKLGFIEVNNHTSGYERVDIKMELIL